MMMKTNSTTDLKANSNVSIINFETFFNVVEADFSDWKFYDDSLYASALKPGCKGAGLTGQAAGRFKPKKDWAA